MNNITISPNEVHLWCVRDEEITSSELLSKYHKLLNIEEKERHKRFHFERHRHQYLVTRALVRTVLSFYIPEISPEQWEFKKNKYGKPSIAVNHENQLLQFNIAHAEKLVILGISKSAEIGVDVEYTQRDRKIYNIIDFCFSPTEVYTLKGLEEKDLYEKFYTLWTLKEAYVKARGTGLSTPLDKFSFDFTKNKINIKFEDDNIADDPRHWRFWHIRPSHMHKISVAVNNGNASKELNFSIYEVIPLELFQLVKYNFEFTSVGKNRTSSFLTIST